MKGPILAALGVILALSGCAGAATGSGGGSDDTELQKAYDSCEPGDTIEVSDGGHTLIASGVGEDEIGDLACILVAIETPRSVTAAMDSTTAMMGRQHEEDGDFTYEWSYHPDNGFNLIVEED